MKPSRTLATLLAVLLPASSALAQTPSWWSTRGVLTNTAAADYGPVLLGQLKWVATNACNELTNALAPQGGAGTAVVAMVAGFANTNNWQPANLGQLKAVAEPFHQRLYAVGYYTSAVPWWTAATTDDVDFALATLGQLKTVFSFDPGGDFDQDGLSNVSESQTGFFVDPWNTGSSRTLIDSDDDDIEDGDEVGMRTDPNLADTNKPLIAISRPMQEAAIRWVP